MVPVGRFLVVTFCKFAVSIGILLLVKNVEQRVVGVLLLRRLLSRECRRRLAELLGGRSITLQSEVVLEQLFLRRDGRGLTRRADLRVV